MCVYFGIISAEIPLLTYSSSRKQTAQLILECRCWAKRTASRTGKGDPRGQVTEVPHKVCRRNNLPPFASSTSSSTTAIALSFKFVGISQSAGAPNDHGRGRNAEPAKGPAAKQCLRVAANAKPPASSCPLSVRYDASVAILTSTSPSRNDDERAFRAATLSTEPDLTIFTIYFFPTAVSTRRLSNCNGGAARENHPFV